LELLNLENSDRSVLYNTRNDHFATVQLYLQRTTLLQYNTNGSTFVMHAIKQKR